jgi:flagellar biosynthesis/type III secretory pathway chaperone
MERLLGKFLDLLDGEARLYGSLLFNLQKEKRSVVDSNIEKLAESTKEKENLFLKMRILEEQRLVMAEKLSEMLGEPRRALTLTRLCQLVEEPYATRIRDSQSSLLSLAQSIQEINLSNKALLKHSLDLVKGSLNLLNDLLSSCPVYFRTGRMHASQPSGKVFDGKI